MAFIPTLVLLFKYEIITSAALSDRERTLFVGQREIQERGSERERFKKEGNSTVEWFRWLCI